MELYLVVNKDGRFFLHTKSPLRNESSGAWECLEKNSGKTEVAEGFVTNLLGKKDFSWVDEPIAVHGILEKDEEFLYRVSAGESVSGIALRELGSVSLVKEVIWANQLKLPGLTEGCYLPEGTALILPINIRDKNRLQVETDRLIPLVRKVSEEVVGHENGSASDVLQNLRDLKKKAQSAEVNKAIPEIIE